ncbi:transposase, partial [bacterium]|nr:transposase [bacterium]
KKTGKRYTEEQIIRILDELKSGKTVEEICRTYGVAQSTLYRWKNQYGEMDRDELSRLRELEDENRRLKRIVAQQVLDMDALKDLLSKKW